MTLAAGHTLSHYEILGPLGAGAMGEVYRARDTRLGREVALKVLPEELSGDAERLRRFEREARALASLNHPNVAQVFGIDQVGDTCFMAMELVPGEDLAVRLSRGALPLEDTLEVCRQIAEGVETAHEAGVIHRDLKPANVLLAPDGKVKVLDFGLAKPVHAGTTDSVLSTEEGRLLGTPTYMAPEQARGKAIDRRVDVWAFGCVLFECLTGRRAFEGETLGDVLASVLEKEPDWSRLPPSAPGRLIELVERCLRKDSRRRLRDVGEARVVLEELSSPGRAPGSAIARAPAEDASRQSRFPLAVVVAVLAAALGFWAGRSVSTERPGSRYASVPITTSNTLRTEPNWSPDGEWIAFTQMAGASSDLYVRHVSSGHERVRRAGPGDEAAPSWSPDNRWIAFVASELPGTPVLYAPPYEGSERHLTDTNIRVFDALSYSQALGDRPWSLDSTTLLVSRASGGRQLAVWRIGLQGSEEQLTFPPPGSHDLGATYSFAGDRIAFIRRTTTGDALMSMPGEGGDPVVLLEESSLSEPAWRTDGQRIVFVSERSGTNLWQLDVESGELEPLTFLEGNWAGGVSVSADDRIAYSASWHDTILTTVDLATGSRVPLTSHAETNFGPRFSPDGGSIAYQSNRTGNVEIWVRDEGGEEHQITQLPSDDSYPDWSPDGERLVFMSNRDGETRLYVADRDGSNCRALENQAALDARSGGDDSMSPRWSPSSPGGELIGFTVASDEGKSLWGIPPDGSAPAKHLLDDVADFDWYLDSRRVVYTRDEGRGEELVAVDLETGESRSLWSGPHAEIDVAPDGSAVMFCKGLGHLNMGLAVLELEPPEEPGGLPAARGEPREIVRPEARWHVHHGGWAPDSRSAVYVHDADRGNIYELVEQR